MEQISNSSRRQKEETDSLASQRVYKKTSANSVLTLYLGSRDLISRRGVVEPLRGVIYIDPKFMCSQKIYGQLTLTFRYGREDEEVMGLKFCNEAVIALKQIWPKVNYDENDITPLQQALLDRLGCGAHPFKLEIGMLAPPSVQLIPAKKYNGAPIGTSYDIRVFMSDLTDEKFQRRTTVKLGIRLMHKIPCDLRSIQQNNPIYTSFPKSIRLRLSPKQLKFHHNQQKHPQQFQPLQYHQSSTSKSTPSIDFSSTDFPTYNFPTTSINVDSHPLTLSSSADVKAMFQEEIGSNGAVAMGSGSGGGAGTDDCAIASCSSTFEDSATLKGPEGCIDKPFLWTEGRVSLKASLNKSAYGHGEKIHVTVNIKNNSRKIIRKIRVFAVQHVDVCMFSNGKFKNVVADVNENHQIKPNETYTNTYEIIPVKGPTKNWIAVEGSYSNYNLTTASTVSPSSNQAEPGSPTENNFKIASSAHRGPTTADERNVFAIYVSYYVKVKLTLSGMGGEASLKLPFILGHVDDNDDNDDDDDEGNIKKEQKKQKTTSNNNNLCSSNSKNDNSKSTIKYQTTKNHNKDNIIEEELHENHDTISLLNVDVEDDDDDDDDDGEEEEEEDDNDNADENKKEKHHQKHIQDQILLQRYKLKRSSYSRSCEDVDSFSRNSSVNSIKAKAVIHRQASETND